MPYFSNRTKLIAGSLGILAFGIMVFTFFTYLQISGLIHEEENTYIQKTMEKWDHWAEHNFSVVTSLAETIAADSEAMHHDEKYKFFLSQAANFGYLQYLAYGLEDGYYTVDGWDIPKDYDPRERPWYKTSKSSLTPTITWPYKSPNTNSPLYISFTAPIIKNDQFIGVVTGDVTMEFLVKDFLSELVYRGGNAFLIDRTGRILTHSDKQWVGKHLSELDPLFSVEQIFPVNNYSALVDGDSTSYRITSLDHADYLLVLAMDEAHKNQLLKKELLFLLGYAPFVILLILVSLYFYNKKLFLPIIHSLEHDANTKLPNKTNIKKKIDSRFLAKNKAGMLIIVSFDDYNQLNAAYPKYILLSLQNEVKERIQKLLMPNSEVGFFSENRFIIYSPFPANGAGLEQFKYLQVLSDEVAKAYLIDGQELHCTFCIGGSCFPSDAMELEQLIDNAFSAIACAKEDEMLTYSLFVPEHNQQLGKAILLSNAIKKAIGKQEFQLVYQPQIDACDGQMMGVEALIRWPSAEFERMISPVEFIPVAEASDLIVEIGDYVIDAAIKQISLWNKQAVNVGKVSINISPRQLLKKNFLDKLLTTLRLHKVDASQVELEITETTVLSNPQKSIEIMQALKMKGFSIAMDDFGTGYSSLEYLKIMPLNKLKIDRAFIKDLEIDEKDGVIVKTIVAMANALGYLVLAEGVENQAQLDFLQANGCQLIQGYYFAKPMGASQLARFLDNQLVVS